MELYEFHNKSGYRYPYFLLRDEAGLWANRDLWRDLGLLADPGESKLVRIDPGLQRRFYRLTATDLETLAELTGSAPHLDLNNVGRKVGADVLAAIFDLFPTEQVEA